MKKFICLLLALLIPTMALASTIDLSGLSFDELVELKEQINLAIWESQEWQEVEVPQGVWKVGEDIPAGHWTVRPIDGLRAKVDLGDTLNENETDIKSNLYFGSAFIYSKAHKDYNAQTDLSEFSFVVKDGDYIQIRLGSVIFTPYTGKPDLGFK